MTPNEVITRIEYLINERKSLMSSNKDKVKNGIWQEDIKALELAKKAMQKQIPQKVRKFVFDNGTVNYGCPSCKRKIISKIDGEFCGGDLSDYCDRCTQRLDWNGEK